MLRILRLVGNMDVPWRKRVCCAGEPVTKLSLRDRTEIAGIESGGRVPSPGFCEPSRVCRSSSERAAKAGVRALGGTKSSRPFDHIHVSGVLHHMQDPQAGLRNLRALLAPTGGMHVMVYSARGAPCQLRLKHARSPDIRSSLRVFDSFKGRLVSRRI